MYVAKVSYKNSFKNPVLEKDKLIENQLHEYLSSLNYFKPKKIGPRVLYFYELNDIKFNFDIFNGKMKVYFPTSINDKIIVEMQKVAEKFNGFIFDNDDKPYPIQKIRAAQEKMAKLDAMRGQEFHAESFGVNNMWITFEASKEEVLWYFDKEHNIVLEGAKYPWKKAISMMYSCEGIFVFEYKKWTFVAGIKTEVLFGCPPSTESISEKCHVSKLLEWGKRFNELQFYQHYNRSTFFNAFYRIHAKEIVYGEYETEFYNKTYGAKPDGIIKMPSNEAYNAAGVWSIDPDTLRFEPELKNAKPWIMNIKQNT